MAHGRWRRLIQDKVKQPLAEELLFGKLRHGGEVVVGLKDDALTFRGHARRATHRQTEEGWRRQRQGPAKSKAGAKPKAPKPTA
jgi:ATP-dependent Clp protease ATP-binding subunit ClpA